MREFPGNPGIQTQHSHCHGQDSSSMTEKKKSVVIRRASKYMKQDLAKRKVPKSIMIARDCNIHFLVPNETTRQKKKNQQIY